MPAHAQNFSDASRSVGRSARKVILRDSTLRYGDNTPVDVRVTNLSTTGFSVEAVLDLQIGAIVGLGLGGAGTASARIIRRTNSTYGAQFLQPLSPDRVDAAFKYSEILASIGSGADVAVDDDDSDSQHGTDRSADDYRLGNHDKFSRRTRLTVMAASGSIAWAAIILVWRAI